MIIYLYIYILILGSAAWWVSGRWCYGGGMVRHLEMKPAGAYCEEACSILTSSGCWVGAAPHWVFCYGSVSVGFEE